MPTSGPPIDSTRIWITRSKRFITELRMLEDQLFPRRCPGGQGVAGGARVTKEARTGSCEKDLTPAWSIRPSLDGHQHRSALILDQDHQEFRRLGIAGVPVHDMHIVGAFIEGLSRCQG